MPEALTVTVVGAGGKMGMRVSANLERTTYTTFYAENYPPARDRVAAAGRTLTEPDEAVPLSDVVILAVPDVLLGEISAEIVPAAKPGAIILTLDPAAAYAGLLATAGRPAPGGRPPVPPVGLPRAHERGRVGRHLRRRGRAAGRGGGHRVGLEPRRADAPRRWCGRCTRPSSTCTG